MIKEIQEVIINHTRKLLIKPGQYNMVPKLREEALKSICGSQYDTG